MLTPFQSANTPSATPFRSQQHPLYTLGATLFPFLTGLFLATTSVLKSWLLAIDRLDCPKTETPHNSLLSSALKARCVQVANCPLLTTLVISAADSGPTPVIPLYLFALLPILNFWLLLLYLRFAPWYVLYGVTAFLFSLAWYFPIVYGHIQGAALLGFILLLLLLAREMLIITYLLAYCAFCNIDAKNYILNCSPGEDLISVCSFKELNSNKHVAWRLVTLRVADTYASVLMLVLYLLLLV